MSRYHLAPSRVGPLFRSRVSHLHEKQCYTHIHTMLNYVGRAAHAASVGREKSANATKGALRKIRRVSAAAV